MSTIDKYRAHAEDCLRQASTDRNENDKPLWLTLAQSWLQLAEHADRVGARLTVGHDERELEDAGGTDA